MTCEYDCLHCQLPNCKYDHVENADENNAKLTTRPRRKKPTVAKSIKRVVVPGKVGRPRKYPDDKTRWAIYSAEHREELNAKQRERDRKNKEQKQKYNREWQLKNKNYYKNYYNRKKEERRVTRDERVRALLGNLKNWSWDIAPQFKVEKEESDALREWAKEMEGNTAKLRDLEARLDADT